MHTRRTFVGSALGALGAAQTQGQQQVTICLLGDSGANSGHTATPVEWAVTRLQAALTNRRLSVQVRRSIEELPASGETIVVAPTRSDVARQGAQTASIALPSAPESLAIFRASLRKRPVLIATAPDVRGLVYGVLELQDSVEYGQEPLAFLRGITQLRDQPSNEIRSIARLFVSDIEDKRWFYDKSLWTDYLSMLATHRFNRFSLTLGLGYDLPKQVLDSYFIFAYPFLLRSVPGYDVRVAPALPEGEVERNLAMLQFISAEAARRALHFQLGLWSNTYEWIDSPRANYTIEGLNADNHASYCRDALNQLLRSCPHISGITFRAHSESGIKDGSYDFWKTVFQGVAECGRSVEIDLHAKGIDFRQIEIALKTGQPVLVSPKYTGEHMGLPGHQAAIRELERSRPSSTAQDRSATRYGYADYLREDRSYAVYFRM